MFLIRALPVTQTMRFEAADSTECGDRAESLAHTGFSAGMPGGHRVFSRAAALARLDVFPADVRCAANRDVVRIEALHEQGFLYDRLVVRAVRFVNASSMTKS